MAGLLLFAPLILAGNEIGSLFRYPDIGAAVLFPPYALLTAALVVSRPREWVWYILLDSFAHFVTHWPQWPLTWVLLANIANVARALSAAVLVARLFDLHPRLNSMRGLWVFLGSCVVVAPTVGATLGALNAVWHDGQLSYWRTWNAWFMSNALTGLTMLPGFVGLFACIRGSLSVHATRRRVLEMLLMAVALCATCVMVFSGGLGPQHLALPLSGALPILIWSALRFGALGASAALTVVTYAAIWSVDRGMGPIFGAPPDDGILALQVFVLFTAVPVLFLASVASARQSVVRLHRALLASLQDHIALLDARGVVLEVNESWRRFAASSNAPSFHLVGAGDDYLAACRSSAELGDLTASGVLDGVTRVLSRDRRRFEIDYDDSQNGHQAYTMSVEALERPDGGAVVTRSNVTARRQAQMEIEEQRRELSHLARVAVLGQLSGAFAHELNQPLTAILSNAETARELLRREPANLDYVKAILRDIISDDRRAAAMIHRLRGLLKRGDLRFQLIGTMELVGDVLDLARTELIARRIVATAAVNPEVPTMWGDKVQLQQVLLNLILNACEAMGATEAGHRRVVLTVDRDGPHNAHVAVRDNGSGLPAHLLDRLFEPFVTTKPDGLGLGLSISRTIVAAHGGRLWAENNPDGGATMHCVLPVTAPSRAAIAAQAASHVALGQSV